MSWYKRFTPNVVPSMYTSKVQVQYRRGGTAAGVRVVLSFSSPLGGMTKPVFTDSHGIAIIAHASKGKAEVYVSGTRCDSFESPGSTVVFIA